MASVSISLYQKREAITDGYRVTSEVTSATDINEELFVYKVVDGNGPDWTGGGGTDTYEHVATTADVNAIPTFTAKSSTDEFYRHEKVIYETNVLGAADDHATIVKTRIDQLQADFDEELDAWEDATGTDYTYESADAEVSFTVKDQKTIQAGPAYRLTLTIQDTPTGIDKYLFLFELDDVTPDPNGADSFVQVVTPYDVATYPDYPGTWVDEPYYRYEIVYGDAASPDVATTLGAAVRVSLESLAQTYDTHVDDFEGEETTVYP